MAGSWIGLTVSSPRRLSPQWSALRAAASPTRPKVFCYGEFVKRSNGQSVSAGNGAAEFSAPTRLVILGATGSIGRSCADVILNAPGRFEVEALVGGRDGASLAKCAVALRARFAAVADPDAYGELKAGVAGHGIEVGAGPEAVKEAALRDADLVVAAIAGTVGL